MHKGLMCAALRETLDSVVTPAVRDAILTVALAEMGELTVPTDVNGFRDFVRGPLRQALTDSLGDSLADTLVADLERLGCSIPPTIRPASGSPPGRRAGSVRTASSRSQRAARSATPHPNGNHHSPLPPRRSLTPFPGRRLTPRPGTTRSSELPPPPTAEAESNALSTRDLDPLAALPDLHAHLGELGYPAPPFSGPISVPSPFGSAEYPAVAENPSVSEGRPVVVVATRDRMLLRTLTEWLVNRARVINVANVLDLVQHAGESGALVVLDCNRPAVRPVAVAALAEELPR